MIKPAAVVFGIGFVLIGVLGFMPAFTSFSPDEEHGYLLDIFAVDPLHNMVHILTGLAAMAAGLTSENSSRSYFKVFGVVYGLVALLGLGYGNAFLFGMMANNLPDAYLHSGFALFALLLGFGRSPSRWGQAGNASTRHPA